MNGARGLTLIELVAATAIFALVSVMALQALTGGLIQRRGIEAADAEQAALARLLALLRQDLAAAVPLAHRPAQGADGRALEPGQGLGFALSRSGLPVSQGGEPGDPLARVIWRLDAGSGQLTRQVLPLVGGAGPAPPGHRVFDGVTGLHLLPLGDWPEAPEGLPPGLEARVETRRHGTLRVVVAR